MSNKSVSLVIGIAVLVAVSLVGAVALGSAGSSPGRPSADGPRELPSCGGARAIAHCNSLPASWPRGWIVTGILPLTAFDPDGMLRPVTFPTISGNPLAWSPDGSELLISRYPGLYIVHSDGGETMIARRAVGGASFTPDGRRVVFTGPWHAIREVSADGGESRPITPPSGVPVTGYGPDMSPDGTKIAYIRVVGQRNRWGVSVMRADGTGRRVLVSPARLNRLSGKLPVDELADVCWSPNGSRLAFTAASGHAYQSWVFTVNADGSRLRRVTSLTAGIWGAAWSPDGTRIASSDSSGDVITMRPNGTDLRRVGHPDHYTGFLAWNPVPEVNAPHR